MIDDSDQLTPGFSNPLSINQQALAFKALRESAVLAKRPWPKGAGPAYTKMLENQNDYLRSGLEEAAQAIKELGSDPNDKTGWVNEEYYAAWMAARVVLLSTLGILAPGGPKATSKSWSWVDVIIGAGCGALTFLILFGLLKIRGH